MKITDTNYTLSKIFAVANLGVLNSGTTQPMKILGYNQDSHTEGQFVVKFINSTRMNKNASCRELLGAWIGKELDFDVIEPVIVEVSLDFVDTFVGKDGYNNARKSIGINFGSVFEAGYMEFLKETSFFTDKM